MKAPLSDETSQRQAWRRRLGAVTLAVVLTALSLPPRPGGALVVIVSAVVVFAVW